MNKRLLLTLVLCLPLASGLAGPKKAKAGKNAAALDAGAIGSPEGPAAPAITAEESDITLKDGQKFKGMVQGYDSYFLDVKATKGNTFHIPWPEVGSVNRGGKAEEWAQAYTTPEQNVVVTTAVTPLSSGQAFRAALFPGILVHGWGHYQARDTDRFYALMGAEVFGLMVGAFGATEMSGPVFFKPNPSVPGDNDDTARILAVSGAVIFTGSWLWDVAFASSAAERFNKEHGLALNVRPMNNGAVLAMHYGF